MRTTIRLDDDLLRQAKVLAAESGRTLTAVIEDALREAVARRNATSSRAHVDLPTFSASLMPGIDLDDSSALLDLMEAGDAAS